MANVAHRRSNMKKPRYERRELGRFCGDLTKCEIKVAQKLQYQSSVKEEFRRSARGEAATTSSSQPSGELDPIAALKQKLQLQRKQLSVPKPEAKPQVFHPPSLSTPNHDD